MIQTGPSPVGSLSYIIRDEIRMIFISEVLPNILGCNKAKFAEFILIQVMPNSSSYNALPHLQLSFQNFCYHYSLEIYLFVEYLILYN